MSTTNPAKTRLDIERASVKTRLRAELINHRIRVEHAIAALDGAKQIDEHLIANASMLTADIARWNLVRDLTPLVADPVVDARAIAREPGKPDRRKKSERRKQS